MEPSPLTPSQTPHWLQSKTVREKSERNAKKERSNEEVLEIYLLAQSVQGSGLALADLPAAPVTILFRAPSLKHIPRLT